MNLTLNEVIDLAKQIGFSKRPVDVLTILGVPFCYLSVIKEVLQPYDNIVCAAQNHHHLASGAHTGEISANMLASMGIDYVILGHSERRAGNNESDEILKQKLLLALENKLNIIFCCGEPLEIRENGTHNTYVLQQLKSTICTLSENEMQYITIAYEPIWAIGTGKTATSDEAQDMHQNIRDELALQFNSKIANNV
jgi:triosephosphate isomerase